MATVNGMSNALKLSKNYGPRAAVDLYRKSVRVLPRVLSIYCLNDISVPEGRRALANLFRANANVKDKGIQHHMIVKGYMELEETLMQYKQKSHLMYLLGEPAADSSLRLPQGKEDFSQKFVKGRRLTRELS